MQKCSTTIRLRVPHFKPLHAAQRFRRAQGKKGKKSIHRRVSARGRPPLRIKIKKAKTILCKCMRPIRLRPTTVRQFFFLLHYRWLNFQHHLPRWSSTVEPSAESCVHMKDEARSRSRLQPDYYMYLHERIIEPDAVNGMRGLFFERKFWNRFEILDRKKKKTFWFVRVTVYIRFNERRLALARIANEPTTQTTLLCKKWREVLCVLFAVYSAFVCGKNTAQKERWIKIETLKLCGCNLGNASHFVAAIKQILNSVEQTGRIFLIHNLPPVLYVGLFNGGAMSVNSI